MILHLVHLGNLVIPVLRHKKPSGTHRPAFSIVVAARNECDNLKVLLPLILNQKYANYEIIIALDRCSDESESYLDDLSGENSNLSYLLISDLPEGYDGKKHALTQAINAASSEWIILIDADCRPQSELWIENFAKAIGPDTSILIGVSPYKKRPSLLNQFIQYETIYTAMKYISAALRKRPYMAVGRNLAYKKALFMKGNGFYPYQGITGGDDDLFIQKYANAKNTQVVTGLASLTVTDAPRSPGRYLTQKTRHLHVGKYYKKKALHVYWTMNHLLLWLCFISLMFATLWNNGVILTFILLIVIKGLIFNLSSRKLGFYYNPFFLPISDLIYAVLYPLIGIWALLHTKVKWK